MSKNKSKRAEPDRRPEPGFNPGNARQRAEERNRRKLAEQRTIRGLKRILRRMLGAGIVLILAGIYMTRYTPLYAEKQWTLLIGVRLPLPRVVMIFGCIMVIVSIVCFLRSYRCPYCGGLLAATPFTRITKCRSCGRALSESENYFIKEEEEE